MLYQQSLFFISMEPPGLPSKKQKVYTLCKNLIAVSITLIALIPIIYILGSDEVLQPSRPLFSSYAEDPYFQAKIAEIQSTFHNNLVVNLHLQGKENSTRQWENLQEFVRYLGYRFNRQDIATVNRLIVPAEVKPQKKGKNTPSAQSLRLKEQAYAFINNGQMNVLKNKLNKVALNTINRLKIKQKDVKNGGISDSIKNTIIDEVVAPKVWIITIHPQNWKYHSSEELKKQITALSKEREKDSFIVVSLGPADPQWKKMKAISINIDQKFFSSIKGKLKQIIKASLPFEINTTRVIESILCHYQTSLYQLNNFLQNCNSTFSCYNSIKLLLKKTKKGEDSRTLELLNELCNIGHYDEEDAQFKKVLNDLGFYGDHGAAEENIKLYFAIANGKKCKGAKQCNYQWLMKDQKSQQNQTKLQQSKKVQTNKTEALAKENIEKKSSVQTVTQVSKKEKLPNKNRPKSTKSKDEDKTSQKLKKQSKKEEQKPKNKQNKVKPLETISKKKLKQKIVKLPKTIEKSQKQCLKSSSKLECQEKTNQQKQVKVQQIQNIEEISEEIIQIVDDSPQVIATNETSQQAQIQETENLPEVAQSEEDESKEDVEIETVEIAETLIQTQTVKATQEEAVAVEDEPRQQPADKKQLQVVEQEQQSKPAQLQNNEQAKKQQTVIEQIIPATETENVQNDGSETIQTQILQGQDKELQNKQQPIQQDEQVPIQNKEPQEANQIIEALPSQTENQAEPSQSETLETPENVEQQAVAAVQTEAIVTELL